MAWDSKSAVARRHQNGAASLTLQQRTPSPSSSSAAAAAAAIAPKSSHVADPFLQDFLRPGRFDPAAYWNAKLGAGSSLGVGSTSSGQRGSVTADAADLAALAAEAQTTLSHLGAHTARLTGTLSQLTDDILRSGSRLAYEVELLRGETIGLAEVLAQSGAQAETEKAEEEAAVAAVAEGDKTTDEKDDKSTEAATAASAAPSPAPPPANGPPPALAQLRMLAQVRARLDAVIHVFGDAMEFVMPPSALSVSASFLSVSGPESEGRRSSDGGEVNSLEDRGQQVLRAKREEIARLLDPATGDVDADLATAAARVAALRALCRVWAGTAEDKARVRFVEGLQQKVEERQQKVDRERDRERAERERAERKRAEQLQKQEQQRDRERERERDKEAGGRSSGEYSSRDGATAAGGSTSSTSKTYSSGYGFISQLQKIRGGL